MRIANRQHPITVKLKMYRTNSMIRLLHSSVLNSTTFSYSRPNFSDPIQLLKRRL